MIRIDEIYNNTFWPWLRNHRPGTRLFVCDPFGRSDPASVINFGSDKVQELNYIFFFDQEPIHLNIHNATFEEVLRRNKDITGIGAICTSEKNSEFIQRVCSRYGWKSFYYFFHGWAALDWYRGYDKTFLIKPIVNRFPTKTFIAPNRIIAGERQHRLEMLYWIFKFGLNNNHISCPAICPVEGISIHDACQKLKPILPDIQSIFSAQQLPICFDGENDHPMHSCWLSLFDQAADSLLYLVTETVATGARHHLTEKTFKPIAMAMPFVLVATAGSLEYLRSYGFKTFHSIWDESYDLEKDDHKRIQKIADLLLELNSLSISQRQKLLQNAGPIIQHNWNHFYNGGFETILWKELQDMLNAIEFNS